MSEAGVNPPGQDIRLAGKNYVLIPKLEYERLRRQVDGMSKQALTPFAGGEIGPDLRDRRRKASLTLKEVARRAGIRLETLSRIETGRTNPSARTVQAVLRALEGSTG
jgi:DNA-binding XRE family transcriptional regulator